MGADVKQEVRQFYDQVGWQQVAEGLYQNAHYEDLRPVSRAYIQRCHGRVARCLHSSGQYLLDAGSGPIQYADYLAYSRSYKYRVCADISIVALQEARKRIGDHGLYVAADVAHLPFKPGVFDGVVSLHTIHHLPEDEHLQAYGELYRVLRPGRSAAVVNGWPSSSLMKLAEPFILLNQRSRRLAARLVGRASSDGQRRERKSRSDQETQDGNGASPKGAPPKGTFTSRHDARWVRQQVGAQMPLEIYPWRSVSVRFMRNLIHPWMAGRLWLRLLYLLEERFPRFFGENGQYPLIVIRKPDKPQL